MRELSKILKPGTGYDGDRGARSVIHWEMEDEVSGTGGASSNVWVPGDPVA